jgi:fibro-slime domain-containing protein
MFTLRIVHGVLATRLGIFAVIVGAACSPTASAPPLGNGGYTANSGASGGDAQGSGGGGVAGYVGAGGSVTITLPDPSSFGGAISEGGAPAAEVWPPTDPAFVNVTDTTYGAFAVKPMPPAGSSGGGGGNGGGGSTGNAPSQCEGLYGVIRDFKMGTTSGGHPDFEKPTPRDDKGIVSATLGSDGKPVYAAGDSGTTRTTSGKANFDKWYNDVTDVNQAFLLRLHFVPNGTNVITFGATAGNQPPLVDVSYFPIDNLGWGNQNQPHNFSFTTEIHTSFSYNGGETFTFQGDDDVFVFINGKLVIDLGGIHLQETATVNLDAQAEALGLTKGQIYDLAVFGAERHTSQSNFRIDTTLAFTNCGVVNGVVY